MSKLFVFDTNSLISAALTPHSSNRKAIDKAIFLGELVASHKTIEELIEVLFRKKFDKYFIDDNERWIIINKIESTTKIFTPLITINECRDSKTINFLN